MNSPRVFPAATAHADAVGRLLFDFNTEFHTSGPDAKQLSARFARLLERDDVIVLLTGNDQDPTGFAFLTLRPTAYYDGPLAQLEELYVRPALRDQGIGTAPLETTIRRYVSATAGRSTSTSTRSIRTRRSYERHGFINIEPGADYRMLCYIQQL